MKMIAFTPHGYWQSRRNRYDTFVTVMGLVWAITNYTLAVSIFLLSRLQMPATYLFMFSPFSLYRTICRTLLASSPLFCAFLQSPANTLH